MEDSGADFRELLDGVLLGLLEGGEGGLGVFGFGGEVDLEAEELGVEFDIGGAGAEDAFVGEGLGDFLARRMGEVKQASVASTIAIAIFALVMWCLLCRWSIEAGYLRKAARREPRPPGCLVIVVTEGFAYLPRHGLVFGA